MMQHKNWAGNLTYQAGRVHTPETVEQVQELVRQHEHLKALGTRHSFNRIADTEHDHVMFTQMNRITALDRERRTVTVEAGVRYGDLCAFLDREGFALHNVASLPHISVAGAVATATHGSGDGNGNLSTAVSGMEIVTADGELRTFSRDDAAFNGLVIHLGGAGVVTRITLDVVPRFDMRQEVYLNLPLTALEANFEAIFSAAYSVSLFTAFRHDAIDQVWLKSRVDAGTAYRNQPEFFGAVRAVEQVAPIAEISPERCTEQLGIPGAWHDRLHHFRMSHTPSFGEELQSEYFVPRQHAQEAIARVFALKDELAPHLFVSEIRSIAADDLWMSPCYQQACIGIHFTWRQHYEAVDALLLKLEQALLPLQARPHWAKLFSAPPQMIAYPKFGEFRALLERLDPNGKFRNAYLDAVIFKTDPL